MPSLERDSNRMVIAGPSSLLGIEPKSLLEESRFAGWDLRLVDEDVAAGTLSEAGGELAVIRPVEDDTFQGARFAFFTGSLEFAKRCVGPAHKAGAAILDFSHLAFTDPGAALWFPQIESLTGNSVSKAAKTYGIFSAPGTAVAGLALTLRKVGMKCMVAVVNDSVSEAGHAGIAELETQATQLLSFQGIGSGVFDVHSAFNTAHRYGPRSAADLQRRGQRVQSEIAAALGARDKHLVSIQVVHTPVFYGSTFAACTELELGSEFEQSSSASTDAGFVLAPADEAGSSNVSVAGEKTIFLAQPVEELTRPGSWWFWGAADNLRLPAANAIKLTEMLS